MKCSGRSLHGVGIDTHAVVCGNDDGIHSGTLASAGNGTEVAHVGHAIEHHEQRVLALLIEHGHKVLDALIGHSRREGDDALMVLGGKAVELLDGHTLHRDELPLQCIEEFARKLVLQAALNEYLVNVFARFDSLDDGTGTKDEFVLVDHSVTVDLLNCKISASREKMQVYLRFSEAPPNFCLQRNPLLFDFYFPKMVNELK